MVRLYRRYWDIATWRPYGLGIVLAIALTLSLLKDSLAFNPDSLRAPASVPPQGLHYTVTVYDYVTGTPLELARVSLYSLPAGKFIKGRVTSAEGIAAFTDLNAGRYRLRVHTVGYTDVNDTVTIDPTHTSDSVGQHETGSDVVVEGTAEPTVSTVDPLTGNQVFEAETYHAPPTARMTDLVQQNLNGAVRAPTGEVHIRGQHGEFMYYVDGAPIPLGVFGGLNEVVDPKVIQSATFMTGGFPAEYGGQMAAVVDIQNRVPTGQFHLDFSGYGGSYLPTRAKDLVIAPNRSINSNGQQLSISDHVGNLGFFLSGSRQETDRRIDPPVQTIFHDHGFDYFLYGKADYLLTDKDFLTLNVNYGVTNTQVPFDSMEPDPLHPSPTDDAQYTTNTFQTLTYSRILSSVSEHESNLLVAAFAREGSLKFTAGTIDEPRFVLAGSDTTRYNLSEDRSFATIGVRAKFDDRLSHELAYAFGGNFSETNGNEDFTTSNALLQNGPEILTNVKGSDFGAFLQAEFHPFEWTRIDAGLRYDQHIAPDIHMESQISPRLKWNFLLGDNDDAYLYYGRMFMPNNVEGLRSLASNVSASSAGGNANSGTLAERDNFYEAVYTHTFDYGFRTKAAYFRKDASPGVDDQTIGSSAVKTPVNIAEVHTQGIELGIYYASPTTPFSGYINSAIIHAYGSGAITGGFLSVDDAGTATDLDHDQRLSIVASLNYQPQDWFANITGIYGSGLTNGNPSGSAYETGLFQFNQFAHVTPAWIVNVAAGCSIHLAGEVLEPSLYVSNLFDHEHLLKGAFFSGASWEEPRNVVLKLAIHI